MVSQYSPTQNNLVYTSILLDLKLRVCFSALFFIERKVSLQNADEELYERFSAKALAMLHWAVTFMSLTDKW